MRGLTPRRLARLAFIADYYAEHGYGPSFTDLSAAWGVRGKAIAETLEALAERGLVRREAETSRTLRPTHEGLGLLERTLGHAWRPLSATHALVEVSRCSNCGADTFVAHEPWLCATLSEELTTPEGPNHSNNSNGSTVNSPDSPDGSTEEVA